MKRFDGITIMLLLAAALAAFWGSGPVAPQTPGASIFFLLHDAKYDDARFAELLQETQDSASPVGRSIAAAGWKFSAPDDDAVMGDGTPDRLLTKLGVHGTINDARRELLAVAPPDKLLAKEPVPGDATAESLLAMMKARGKR